MNKILNQSLIFLFFFLINSFGFSQSGVVGGQVVSKEDNKSIIGATVYIVSKDFKRGVATNMVGEFNFTAIPYGNYILTITSLGFKKKVKTIVLNKANLNLGKIRLKESSIKLETYKVEAKIPLAVQKGDTTEYSSEAYKVNKDASAEDLVEKMPGISNRDGVMTAHGETVQQVLVDGKPFFGEDPSAALKNIPAAVIDKIQVVNEKSDESKATGFDDGNTSKTINVITKKEYKNGQFGKFYSGIGSEEENFEQVRYKAGGNYNLFKNAKRISVVGQFNNVNQQNFSGEDLFGITAGKKRKRSYQRGGNLQANSSSFTVPQQQGIAKTNAMGVNFSNSWGDKTDFIGSYFYNNSRTDALENVIQNYYSTERLGQSYSERDSSVTNNANRRVALKFKHKISANDEIFARVKMSMQDSKGESKMIGNTILGPQKINELKSNYVSNLVGYNSEIKIYYNHRFAKKGRSYFVQVRNNLSGNDGTSYLNSESLDFAITEFDTLNQQTKLFAIKNSLAGKVRYTEPIGKNGGLMFDYDIANAINSSDNNTYNAPYLSEEYNQLDSLYSSSFETNTINNNFAFGYRYFSKKIFTFLRVKYSITDLDLTSKFPETSNKSKNFKAILPFAMLKYSFSRSKNLFIHYRVSVSNPTIDQLNNFLDNRNPLQLQIGNNELQQSKNTRISLRYNTSNIEKATTFSANINASFSKNRISTTSHFYNKDTMINGVLLSPGSLLNSYTNLNGYSALSAFASYGFPLKPIRCNLNVEARVNFANTPTLINGIESITKSNQMEGGVVISSNISENFDFIISVRPSLNTIISGSDLPPSPLYFSNNSRVKLTWTFLEDYVLKTQFDYQTNAGFSEELGINFMMWNASISKKIFKNRQGQISFSVFDIMKQNNALSFSTTNTYFQEATSNVLQRYFMVGFSYNIKKFSGSNS